MNLDPDMDGGKRNDCVILTHVASPLGDREIQGDVRSRQLRLVLKNDHSSGQTLGLGLVYCSAYEVFGQIIVMFSLLNHISRDLYWRNPLQSKSEFIATTIFCMLFKLH